MQHTAGSWFRNLLLSHRSPTPEQTRQISPHTACVEQRDTPNGRTLLRMMGDGPMWEPSTKKEVTYYDKLFSVVDRDKSGTLDGNEAVQFLAHSGLTQTQLKVHRVRV